MSNPGISHTPRRGSARAIHHIIVRMLGASLEGASQMASSQTWYG